MNKSIERSLLLIIMCAFVFSVVVSGCTSVSPIIGTDENENTIRISMYNDIAYSAWRDYVEAQCPDITFIWENNRNNTQNLIYQAKHDDLADIVTIRRFENDSAAELSPYLMDLKNEELASSFTAESLEPFTFNGKVDWFPAPGMIEALYANASLFERNGIKVPETIDELEEACQKFYDLGMDGLHVALSQGYRSIFMIEAFTYPSYFAKEDGQKWLKSFLSGNTAGFNESGSEQLVSLMRNFVNSHVISPIDLTVNISDEINDFDSEKTAMMINGSDHHYIGKSVTHYQIIPCLGKNKDEQILFTYPIFNTAVSKKVRNNTAKKILIEHVLKVMYSTEAQQILARDADALLSYNNGIDLPVDDLYQSVSDLISEKKCFIRFLNRNMFAASASAMKDILNRTISDTDIKVNFNKNLQKSLSNTEIGISNIEASNQLSSEFLLERPAASVLAQTVKEETGADMVLIEGKCAAAPIYKGKYTESELNAVIADENLYEGNLNGSQLQNIFNDSILATTTYSYRNIEPLVDFPAISGMKAFLSQDGNKNLLIALDGKSLESDTIYKTVISQTIYSALKYLQNVNLPAFSKIDDTLLSTFRKKLSENSLPSPVSYFEVGAAQ